MAPWQSRITTLLGEQFVSRAKGGVQGGSRSVLFGFPCLDSVAAESTPKIRTEFDAYKKIGVGYVCAQAPEPLSGAAGSILRASNAEWVSGLGWTVQRLSRRRTAISVAAVLAGAAGILSQRHPPPNFPYPNTINNLKLPEQDGEIMHSMDETTTDAAFERETTDPSAALPAHAIFDTKKIGETND